MHRYTTPTKTIRVEGVDLTSYDMMLSLRQLIGYSNNAHEVDIGLDDLTVETDGDDTLVTVTLTQEQTGGFVAGMVDAQLNYGAGTARMATGIFQLEMRRNLLNGNVEFATGTPPDTSDEEIAVSIGTMPPKGSITSDYLADGAVTTPKIAGGAVTSDKLGSGSVGTTALAGLSVITAKLADLSVTTGKLANNAVTGAKVASGAICASHLNGSAYVVLDGDDIDALFDQ